MVKCNLNLHRFLRLPVVHEFQPQVLLHAGVRVLLKHHRLVFGPPDPCRILLPNPLGRGRSPTAAVVKLRRTRLERSSLCLDDGPKSHRNTKDVLEGCPRGYDVELAN